MGQLTRILLDKVGDALYIYIYTHAYKNISILCIYIYISIYYIYIYTYTYTHISYCMVGHRARFSTCEFMWFLCIQAPSTISFRKKRIKQPLHVRVWPLNWRLRTVPRSRYLKDLPTGCCLRCRCGTIELDWEKHIIPENTYRILLKLLSPTKGIVNVAQKNESLYLGMWFCYTSSQIPKVLYNSNTLNKPFRTLT